VKLADSYGAQSASTLSADGFDGTMRYVSHQAGKCITTAEAQGLRAAGKILGLVFEDGAANAQGGYAQGVADGAFAAQVAHEIGYPANCVIFAAVDFDAQPWQIPTIDAYFQGFRGHGFPTGPYGSDRVVNAVMSIGMGTQAWQTSAWSGGQLSRYANLYQDRYGQIFDNNDVIQWTPLWGLAPVPTPPVVPPPGAKMNFAGFAPTKSGNGYWACKPDGSVLSLGDATYHGGANVANGKPVTLSAPIVDMAATPSGNGYWLVGSDGGVFTYGDAQFHGSTGDVKLVAPIRNICPTPTGNGYWLEAIDGGVFNFGDAKFKGSFAGK
jgi:hypothetical protein